MKRDCRGCSDLSAHGHSNPIVGISAELVKRGNTVRFYSSDEFIDRIYASGAEFIFCNKYLPILSKQEAAESVVSMASDMLIEYLTAKNENLHGYYKVVSIPCRG